MIIGKTGQLGSALLKDAQAAGHEVIAPDKSEVNILMHNTFLNAMMRYKPNIVINTAAYNDVPQCEKEPDKAFQLNCIAVRKMAEICDQFKTWFVTFSTDYVFNGKNNEGDKKFSPYTESDHPAPLQVYGISKLAGEYCTLLYEKSIVVRTSGLYGTHTNGGKGNFVDNRIADAEINKGEPFRLEMSSDQTFSPTYTEDLSQALLQLIDHPQAEPGIYHLVNDGYCIWYELTNEIYKIMDTKAEVVAVDKKGFSGGVRRPLFSALRNTKARRLGIELPHWKDALKRYLEEKHES